LTTIPWPADRQPQPPHIKRIAVSSLLCPAVAVLITLLGNSIRIYSLRLLDFFIFVPLAIGATCGIWTVLNARNWRMRRLGILGTVICVPYAFMMLLVLILGLR
jgi:hypothetical protein